MSAGDANTTSVRVKICGIRSVGDAELAISKGADFLGFNLVPSSKRFLEPRAAAQIIDRLRRQGITNVGLIAVVADESPSRLEELLALTGADELQLHGHEPPSTVIALSGRAFAALRIAGPEDAQSAQTHPGTRLLLDAKVEGQLGGTGQVFDWELVRTLCREREVFLAGGLTPSNVATAVRTVRPFAVDVASGVEREPGVKDPELVSLFIQRAKSA